MYQVSLPSLLYVVCGDDNGGLIHSYLKKMVPDPIDNWSVHVIVTRSAYFDRSSGSTPTVGSSRMSKGGF